METPQDAAPVKDEEPTDSWPVWAPAVVEAMRSVPSISRAAKTVEVDRRTIQRLIQRNETFALAISDARDDALDTLEEVMLLRARQGQPTKKTVTKKYIDPKTSTEVVETTVTEDTHISDVIAMFYLKRWRPEYRESYRVENTGPGGGPIQIEGNLNVAVERFRAEVVRLATDHGTLDAP